MELEYISIHKNPSYDPRPNEYKGTIKFVNTSGTVEIQLDNALSNEVLKLCAASLTRATKDIARDMTAAVLEQAGLTALENKA